MKGEDGFTLIETLAILVIIGIFFTIGTIVVNSLIEDSKEDACVQTRRGILDAITMMQYSVDISDEDAANEILSGISV